MTFVSFSLPLLHSLPVKHISKTLTFPIGDVWGHTQSITGCIAVAMSKQNSLDKYFAERKENCGSSSTAKKTRLDDAKVISALPANRFDEINSHVNIVSPIAIDASESVVGNSDENQLSTTNAASGTKAAEQRSYRAWYSQEFKWLTYTPNIGGFRSACRNYWKPNTPVFQETNRNTNGIFISIPFTNRRKVPGNTEKLKKHTQSKYYRTAVETVAFR